MELEPQRPAVEIPPKKTRPQSSGKPNVNNVPKKFKRDSLLIEDEEEVIEGMITREHKSEDLSQSPLKVFINTEILMLVLAVVLGAIIYIFFR